VLFIDLRILSCHLVSCIYSVFFFCCNARIFTVYNSNLSKLYHYHQYLWIAGLHFLFFFRHFETTFTLSVYPKILHSYFFSKVLQHSPFWDAEEFPVASLVCWSALCRYVTFLTGLQPVLLKKKICHSNTLSTIKTGFLYVHNHLFSRTDIPFTISQASVYLQFQNMRYRSISQTNTFNTYLPGLLLCT